MKALLSPLFSCIPFLIEYLSSPAEEAEIDLIQARKCCDFKRMMLESVMDGEGVGIPVPIGYDDIQDIESWPMLQAFALDHVYCPTGFFTARYNVADITTPLEVCKVYSLLVNLYLFCAKPPFQKTTALENYLVSVQDC